jgi:hypothetical protein
MLDSVERGRVELRIRWDAGAKGGKSCRVPITPKLAAAIKRYEGRHRPDTPHLALLINELGRLYGRFGIAAMMDRLHRRCGFHMASTTHSPLLQLSWAGTSSGSEPRWATPTTKCCNAMCGWRRSATWGRAGNGPI